MIGVRGEIQQHQAHSIGEDYSVIYDTHSECAEEEIVWFNFLSAIWQTHTRNLSYSNSKTKLVTHLRDILQENGTNIDEF